MRIEIIESQIDCKSPKVEIMSNLYVYFSQKHKKEWRDAKKKEHKASTSGLEFEEWLSQKVITQEYAPAKYEDGILIEEEQCEISKYVNEYILRESFALEIEKYLITRKENPSLNEIKLAKYKELSAWHKSIFETGKVPTSLGITIDARRYAHKNDLQNIQGLISRYKRGHTLPKFRDANNKDHTLTVEQLEIFVIEIEDYHAEMFNKKHAWALEIGREYITIEELINIEIK